jgi:hypothetical protein
LPSFASGDLVLIYARGRCNVVVEVLAPPRHDPGFLVGRGVPPEDAERWPWVNDAHPKLHVPVAAGVTLSELSVKAQGLQSGHIRLGLSEFAAAVRALGAAPTSLAPTP